MTTHRDQAGNKEGRGVSGYFIEPGELRAYNLFSCCSWGA